MLPVRFGWLLNVLLKTALSLLPGLLAVQFEFELQVVLVEPSQIVSVAKTGSEEIKNKSASSPRPLKARSFWRLRNGTSQAKADLVP